LTEPILFTEPILLIEIQTWDLNLFSCFCSDNRARFATMLKTLGFVAILYLAICQTTVEAKQRDGKKKDGKFCKI
jgi:hypothetical protein